MSASSLPVVIIGAGPVGLAAAAHVLSRDLTPLVFEAGPSVGAGIRRWGHVRLFSPWKFNVDAAAAALARAARLGAAGRGERFPLDASWSSTTSSRSRRRPNSPATSAFKSRVMAVSRQDHDLMKDAGRDAAPFLVRIAGDDGERDVLARAVIDASGTIETPGALGASGLPARGEQAAADRIFYGIPGRPWQRIERRYAGKRVLVVGSGHSAFNALLDLAELAEADDSTHITWAIRRPSLGELLGRGAATTSSKSAASWERASARSLTRAGSSSSPASGSTR